MIKIIYPKFKAADAHASVMKSIGTVSSSKCIYK